MSDVFSCDESVRPIYFDPGGHLPCVIKITFLMVKRRKSTRKLAEAIHKLYRFKFVIEFRFLYITFGRYMEL